MKAKLLVQLSVRLQSHRCARLQRAHFYRERWKETSPSCRSGRVSFAPSSQFSAPFPPYPYQFARFLSTNSVLNIVNIDWDNFFDFYSRHESSLDCSLVSSIFKYPLKHNLPHFSYPLICTQLLSSRLIINPSLSTVVNSYCSASFASFVLISVPSAPLQQL